MVAELENAADLAFLFVVDGPRLQAQSVLLAASLRQHHPGAQLIACLPAEAETTLSDGIKAIFDECGVVCATLPVPAQPWKQPYPHGNKIRALALPRLARWSVFLDTDMVALAAIDPADLPGPMQVSVVPEGIQTWGKDLARWEVAYAHFGLPMPDERIRLLRGNRRMSPPYFNGGFIAIHETDQIDGHNFGGLWHETAMDFDWNVRVGNKRPWLDQITLPLTMKRFGFTAKVVDERNNCSISNGRKLEGLNPAILHYHRAPFLRSWPQWERIIDHALAMVPDLHRPEVEAALTAAGYLGEIADTDLTETL